MRAPRRAGTLACRFGLPPAKGQPAQRGVDRQQVSPAAGASRPRRLPTSAPRYEDDQYQFLACEWPQAAHGEP